MTELEDAEIRSWIAFACERCGCPELAEKITYSFENRRMQNLGQARDTINLIELNAKQWTKFSLQDIRIAGAAGIKQCIPDDMAAGCELLVAFERGDEEMRSAAEIALGQFNPPLATEIESLCRLLDSPDPEMPERTARVLGKIGPQAGEAVPRLLRLLENADNDSSDTRSGVTYALGQIRAREAIPSLVAALSHPEPVVRVATAQALCKIDLDDRAIDVLIENLQDIEAECFFEAAEAIVAIGPPARRAVPVLIKTLKNSRAEYVYHRSLAVEALGAIGAASEAAVPYLVHAILHDSDYCFERCAARAIANIGNRGIAPLVESLGDGSIHVRVAAAEAIGEIGPPAATAVPGLVAMLGDIDLAAQVSAARALGHIGKKASLARRAMRKLLDSQSRRVRRTAKHALKQIVGIERKPLP